MEKKINKVVENHMLEFKNNINSYIQSQSSEESCDMNKLLKFIYEYEIIKLTKEDFQKRKRVKNFVPIYERCCAKRANDEQCTRRKKDGEHFCGTHLKGTPHGVYDNMNSVTLTKQKVDVWAQDIKGIIYYIDKNGNVYQTEEIVTNKENPRIIAKYIKEGDIYSIPEFKI
jgi:hypothetical protein